MQFPEGLENTPFKTNIPLNLLLRYINVKDLTFLIQRAET